MRQRRSGKGVEAQDTTRARSGAATAVAELPPDCEAPVAPPMVGAFGPSGASPTSDEAPINEWGFYDPDLAGIGALISSIDLPEVPVNGNADESPSDLLLRQKAIPDASRTGVLRPGSPFDADGGPQVTPSSAVASCRVGHLAPLSLWARVADIDEAQPRRATPERLDGLLAQWLFIQRSGRNHQYASSDLAARIGELTHPAHVALTGLSPVCRIRAVRTTPLAAVPQPADEMPGWAEPAFTPVPDTIAVEYLQASDAERAAAAGEAVEMPSEADAEALAEAMPEVTPATSPELVPEPTPAMALEPMPEPAREAAAEALIEEAIEQAPAAPFGLGAGPEPLYAMAAEPVDSADDGRNVEALAEFDAVAVAPPAFDAIPLDFMTTPTPGMDLASLDAVSFDRGMAPLIELEPASTPAPIDFDPTPPMYAVDAEPAITALPVDSEPAVIAVPVEPEPAEVAQPVEPEPAIEPPPAEVEPVMVAAAPAASEPAIAAAEPVPVPVEVCLPEAPEPEPPVNPVPVEPIVRPNAAQPVVKKRRRTALALG